VTSGNWLRRWGTWSLRTRLLVSTTLILAVMGGAIALSTTLFLKQDLDGTAEKNLQVAISRSRAMLGPNGNNGGGPGGMPQGGPQQSPGNSLDFLGAATDSDLGAVISKGTIKAAIVAPQSSTSSSNPFAHQPEPLTAAEAAPLAVAAGGVTDLRVTLPDRGDYMVSSEVLPDGDTIVVGVPMGEAESTVDQLIAVEAVVTLIGLVLAGFLSFAMIRLSLRPLDRVAATASRVSRLPLHEGEVGELARVPEADTDSRTEAGQVGASLNRLIDHVASALTARQASETRVRQFVADASHELRTPLASIGGYAELTRRGRDIVPPDTAYALSRIESEAGRMTRLVEDLLLLARLDAGRPLEREPLDLSPLIVDAVRDAHAAVPDHRWQIQLPDEPVLVDGDPHRLHQVLVNLLANAGKHTPSGTTVTASVTSDDDASVVVRIADDGPGIPSELLSTVFERFARGDHSRSRAAGSTGLGLAIVSAVVASHRGQVDVSSVPGSTVFTVRLPASVGELVN
jgi:two-component system OmpR family sensor kinase